MNHYLHALVSPKNPRVPITREEFEVLRKSTATLSAAIALEEIYDLLLANFRELEISVLDATVSRMTCRMGGYADLFDVRSELNRRAINLLSSARLYLDQFPQWLREVGADVASVKARTNELYDSVFEYRFMEALRNHAQHAGLAVHGVKLNYTWLPEREPEHLELHVSAHAKKSELAENKGFKPAVLLECPDQVQIVPAARKYVECLSAVHKDIRSLVEPIVVDARTCVEGAMQRHEAEAGKRFPALYAVAVNGEEVIDKVLVFLEWDDVRLKLVRRNNTPINLSKMYVTSRDRDDD